MKSAGQRKVPNSKRNLDMALQRLYGAGANLVQVRMAMANTIVGQMLPDVVIKGGTSLRLRYGRASSRYTIDCDVARRDDLGRLLAQALLNYAIIQAIKKRSETMPVRFCDRIEINPAVCHGKPVVRGTRIMVSQVLGALSGGDSIEDVLMDYPSLSSEDLSAVFAFAGTLASFEDIPYGNMNTVP